MNFLNHEELRNIFIFHDSYPDRITSRESSWLEFKESFNWSSKDEYAKTMAAFANNHGGYIIFGVKNQPKELLGLLNNNFDNCDEAKISGYLNDCFSPEIKYEKYIEQIKGKNVGVLFIFEAEHKPVVCSKNSGELKESGIYYRYHGRNDTIKYPELKLIIDEIIEDERKSWWEHFEKMSKIGPTNAAILDLNNGKIDGRGGALVIDRKLLPKLKFIKEGTFREKGKPVLKLIGDVKPVSLTSIDAAKVKITDDPNAITIRLAEDEISEKYPLNYKTLTDTLRGKYKNFKTNVSFHVIMKELRKNKKFCWVRYLNPGNSNPKSAHTSFYSLNILDELDKHYK